jgi:hypothetical protein
MHQSTPVAFRNEQSKDILEISIGTGPCSEATLTIVIRVEETGQILYSYVAPFEQHIVPADNRDLVAEAKTFIASEIQSATFPSSDLPPYLEEDATRSSTRHPSWSARRATKPCAHARSPSFRMRPITKDGAR